MREIHLCYKKNDFWQVEIDGEPYGNQTTEDNAEDMIVEMLKNIGIKDTSDIEEWHKAGYTFKRDPINPYSEN